MIELITKTDTCVCINPIMVSEIVEDINNNGYSFVFMSNGNKYWVFKNFIDLMEDITSALSTTCS